MTDAELTKLYNDANGIPDGKAPPITTQRIFTAMRAAMQYQQRIDMEDQAKRDHAKHGLARGAGQ